MTDNVRSLLDVYFQRERNGHRATSQRCTVEEAPGVRVLARYAADRLPDLKSAEEAYLKLVKTLDPREQKSDYDNCKRRIAEISKALRASSAPESADADQTLDLDE